MVNPHYSISPYWGWCFFFFKHQKLREMPGEKDKKGKKKMRDKFVSGTKSDNMDERHNLTWFHWFHSWCDLSSQCNHNSVWHSHHQTKGWVYWTTYDLPGQSSNSAVPPSCPFLSLLSLLTLWTSCLTGLSLVTTDIFTYSFPQKSPKYLTHREKFNVLNSATFSSPSCDTTSYMCMSFIMVTTSHCPKHPRYSMVNLCERLTNPQIQGVKQQCRLPR